MNETIYSSLIANPYPVIFILLFNRYSKENGWNDFRTFRKKFNYKQYPNVKASSVRHETKPIVPQF